MFDVLFRAFLDVWFAKAMVCMWVAFHKNDGNHENDEDNSESYKQGIECWISENQGNHGNKESHEDPECKPQVHQITGLETADNNKKNCFW